MKLLIILILTIGLIGCGESKDGGPNCELYDVGTWQFLGETEFKKVGFHHCGYRDAKHVILIKTPNGQSEMILIDENEPLPGGIRGEYIPRGQL